MHRNTLILGFYRVILFFPLLLSFQAFSQNEWIHNPDYLLTDTIVQYFTNKVGSIELYNCQGNDTLSKVNFSYSRVSNTEGSGAKIADSSLFFRKFEISSGDIFEVLQVEIFNDTIILTGNNEVLKCFTRNRTIIFNKGNYFRSPFSTSNLVDLYDVDSINVVSRKGSFKKNFSKLVKFKNGNAIAEESKGKVISKKEALRILHNKGFGNSERFECAYYVVTKSSNFSFKEKKEYLYFFTEDRLSAKYCLSRNPNEVWAIYRFH